VFRGAALSPNIADRLVEGYEYTDKGFLAQDFLGGKDATYYLGRRVEAQPGTVPVMFRSVLPNGTKAVDVGVGELVMPRNTTVKVLSRSVKPDGTILLEVEYITP
jgi:hypothetical protein